MKKITDNIWIIVLCVLLLAQGVLVVALFRMSKPEEARENRAGALFVDGIDDGSWSEGHYKGLKAACDKLNLELEIEENIAETAEDAGPAIDRLAERGCNIIFLTSDGYDSRLYPSIEKHSDIEFYTISPDSSLHNVNTYYGRLYQVRYLAGILAGRMTKTNVLGYVGGRRTCQENRAVNAFTLGARSVNPDVVVKARFMNDWTDAGAERTAAEKLIHDDGADLITYHASSHTAVDVAEEHSVYSIGFNNSNTSYSDKYLATINCKWETLYEKVLNDFFIGDIADGKYYWHGAVFGTVEITNFSSIVPESVKLEIDERTKKLIKVQDVFYGDIYTNEGEKKCSKGQRISDDALLRKMNWNVEGVEIYE